MSARADQLVLLVGANGGVGKAVARRLLERGHAVIATVSDAEQAALFPESLPGCRNVIALDLADADRTQWVLSGLIATLDRPLDAVIVCAAVSPILPAEMTSPELFRRVHEINCVSHLAIYRAAIASLRRSRGRLVFVSSLSGRVGMPLQAAYVSSKFALEGLVDVLRQEASEWGVEVVLLQPGGIDTPMVDKSIAMARDTLASLREPDLSLYATVFRQFVYRATEGKLQKKMVPPEQVADAAIQAIEIDLPLPRYSIGSDAEQLIGATKTLSDREIDALVLGIYRSAPV